MSEWCGEWGTGSEIAQGETMSKLNTISDKDYRALQDRAWKTGPPMFSAKAIKARWASEAQRLVRKLS